MRRFILVGVLSWALVVAFAQTGGQITGEVRDPSGASDSKRVCYRYQFRYQRGEDDRNERRGAL